MALHRLIIGPGGSGRTHRLRRWVAEVEESTSVAWVAGSSIRPVDEDDIEAALADGPEILVVDDLQWLTDGALSAVSRFAVTHPVWASRRPWPSTERLRMLDDQLTVRAQAERTGSCPAEDYSAFVAECRGRPVSGPEADALLAATGGSYGLTADAIASNWDGELRALPEALIDAVVGRVRRSGADGSALASLLAIEPDGDPGLIARALPAGVEARGAQRGIRAGGLVDSEGALLPLVRAAILADLSTVEREELHDRLGTIFQTAQPERAADHLLAGSVTSPQSAEALLSAAERVRRSDPERALELAADLDTAELPPERLALVRAEAAFHLGRSAALAGLDAGGGVVTQRGALLAYGLDLRDLRWVAAAERELPTELGPHLRALALATVGNFELVADLATPTGPLTTMLQSIIDGLEGLAFGRSVEALAGLAAAVDDFDRLQPDLPLGFSPRLLASFAAVAIGDLAAAEDFVAAPVDGLAGEGVSLRLQLAYVRLLDGRYVDALTLVREGEGDDWGGRDRLLLAVLDAALARRSGDTARLRDSWRRADPVLVRHSPAWLLIDPLTELVAAGAKLGNDARIGPLVSAIAAQVEPFAPSSPIPGNAAWLRLQTALAADRHDLVTEAADDLRQFTPSESRSQARVDAAALWSQLGRARHDTGAALPSETALGDVAAALADSGESWEASRIVGQAAIDVEDAGLARRLLERARSFAVDVDEADAQDPLVARGLSDREADVARLVALGRTHKEVGSQLYISPKTVEHHVARIRQKLGANTRAELLAIVREAMDSTS